ncbi:hypothetical protein [Bradyrhizobium cenepequi]|uniref:hypothetical protein n=1 Tax=Bradyrhizobium cenepequi TaxID=2821403 RepID=UPI001CE23C7F|nr:hypothetical protein [Bradyrhizobium cenepequi]
MLTRLGLASMRTQIYLLAAVPIFLFACYATVRATLRESRHARMEWVSALAAKIPIVVAQLHASTFLLEAQSVLDAADRAGLSAELVDRRLPDEVDLRRFDVEDDTFRCLVEKLMALIDAPRAEATRQAPQLAVRISDARSVVFRPAVPAFPSPQSLVRHNLGLSALVVLPILLLSYCLSYRLTRPLIEFAADAQRISENQDSRELFKADGALEVRSLRDSLNVMQARISQMAERQSGR